MVRPLESLGGDGLFFSGGVSCGGVSLLALAAGLFDAADARVDRAGSWIEALLP